MTNKPQYAGFWIRLIADFFDSTLLDLASCVIGLMGLGVLFWVRRIGWLPPVEVKGSLFDSIGSLGAQVSLIAIRSVLSLIYFTWVTYRFGTTLGKRPFRIYVVAADQMTPVTLKQSLLRCLGYIASYLPFGCGFLMVAFQPEKRALHDLIAGTSSVVAAKRPKSSK